MMNVTASLFSETFSFEISKLLLDLGLADLAMYPQIYHRTLCPEVLFKGV